jgi:hypothetical protein
MNLSEQDRTTLRGLKENPREASRLHQAGIVYWKNLEENVLNCIRENKNLEEFLKQEYDFINFGISPEVFENAQPEIDRLHASVKPGRYLRIMQVSATYARRLVTKKKSRSCRYNGSRKTLKTPNKSEGTCF